MNLIFNQSQSNFSFFKMINPYLCKNPTIMKQSLILFFCITFLVPSNAQLFGDIENLLRASEADAAILAEDYTRPLGKSNIYALNAGWANSAKTHKKLGFDLTFGAAAPFIPSADETFMPEGLTSLQAPADGLPTIFGDANPSTLTVNIPAGDGLPELTGTLEFPGGVKDDLPGNTLPIPFVQAGLGLFFDTDLIVRYVPQFESEGTNFNLFGLGLKHNLMQYFGPLDKLPLNVALLAAFTQTELTYDIPEQANQQIAFDVNAYTVQALASLDLPVISLFGGVGYSVGTSKLRALGDYDLAYDVEGSTYTRTLTDPLDLSYDASGMMGVVGMRMNLLFLKIFANYTLQEYNTLTAGLSINFR